METPKYHDIVLKDIQLHVTTKRKPLGFFRSVFKMIRSGKSEGRCYQNGGLLPGKDGKADFTFQLPLDTQEQVNAAEREGKTVRFFVPKDGVPVYAGKDMIEFVKAHQRRGDMHLMFPGKKLS